MCSRCAEGFGFFGLAEPQAAMLESYVAALRTGWSPNNRRNVSAEQLADIARDSTDFLARLLDPDGENALPDGTLVPRLPMRYRWLWDGAFCGSIGLRYQSGTSALPPYVAGHIGYAVVPWKRRHGYASRALRQMLDEAREVGLDHVELMCDPINSASQAVITRNGGVRAGTWSHPAFPATGVLERYVIRLART